MVELQSYMRVLLSVTSGLLTLLGSVGIFISLIIQRKVERLQDILEEFMDLSYQEDTNLTSKMFKLIEKYQMHYLVPDAPTKTLIAYVNLSIGLVIVSWTGILVFNFTAPLTLTSLIYFFPIFGGFVVLLYFRQLLKNVISPINNWLLSTIIPPPTALRSVSYLSKYVNVSVKSILKQARLGVVIRYKEDPKHEGLVQAEVVLKEELSMDDFFYYFYLSDEDKTYFVSFGEIYCCFPPDKITKKPIPVQRNVNILLGRTKLQHNSDQKLLGQLLIFPREEKHPIQYTFYLQWEDKVIRQKGSPEIKINHLLMYHIKNNKVQILNNEDKIPMLSELSQLFELNNKRRYLSELPADKHNLNEKLQTSTEDVYIS